MPKELGDEIMILEGLGDSSLSATRADLLNAVVDFPVNTNEVMLSGSNDTEDSLDDIIPLSKVIGLSGFDGPKKHHHHKPHHKPHYKPSYPYPYPVPVYPDYTEPSVIVVEKEEDDTDDLEAVYQTFRTGLRKNVKRKSAVSRHIKRLESKMKELHPGKVKVTPKGVEGFGATSSIDVSKSQIQVAAIRKAAEKPESYDAKVIVKNLDMKAKELDKIAKTRLEIANKAIADYRKDKALVDRLDRVSKAKSIIVLNAAAEGQSGRQVERKMDREIKDVRRLHDRSVGVGRRAIHNMKTYALASMLSKNASGQAFITKAAKLAVEKGKPEEARVLTAALEKHNRIARSLKAARKRQVKLWESESDQHKYDRLVDRRDRFMKAIALINAKASKGPLSEEDKKNLREAHAQLYRAEVTMIGLHGGAKIIPQDIKPKSYSNAGVTLSEFQENPFFTVEVAPNDPSGMFLQGMGAIFPVEFSVGPKKMDVAASIGAIFEPVFSVKPKRQVVEASFGAIVEPRFTAQMVQPPVEAMFSGMVEPTFTERAFQTSPKHIGRWLEDFALGWFSDSGDLVDDTNTGLHDLLKDINEWDAPIDCEGCSGGLGTIDASIVDMMKKKILDKNPKLAKKVKEAEKTAYSKMSSQERAIYRLKKALGGAGSCKGVNYPVKNPPHGKKAYLAKDHIGKWVVKGKDGKEHLDWTFFTSRPRPVWCKINPKGQEDILYTPFKTKSGMSWQALNISIKHPSKNIFSKIGGAVASVGNTVYKATKTAVKGALKATEKVAKGAINVTKVVASTTFNTLKSVAKGDLKGAANSLVKGTKGVAGEVYNQAKGVYDYAKSQFNAVCSFVSDGAVKTIGTAAATAATGGAGAVPAALALQYGSKICGAAAGVGKAVKALSHGDLKGAANALAKTAKGVVNVKDAITAAAGAVGVPIPPILTDALNNAKSISEAGRILKQVAQGKDVDKILAKAIQDNAGDLINLSPEAKNILKNVDTPKDMVEAIARSKGASAAAILGKAPESLYYQTQQSQRSSKNAQLTKAERKEATQDAVRNAMKALGFSGDIYDIAEQMDRKNMMARKVQNKRARIALEKRKRISAQRNLRAMQQKMREDMAWNGLEAAPESFKLYKPVRMISSSIEEVPYTEPQYRKFNPYRKIAVTPAFGNLPGNFPKLYEPVWTSVKHGLGEVKYVPPQYRKFNPYRRRVQITSSVEGLPGNFPQVYSPVVWTGTLEGARLMSILEGASIAAPMLLT